MMTSFRISFSEFIHLVPAVRIKKTWLGLALLLGFSGMIQARTNGSILCLYNYTNSAYRLEVSDVDSYDWRTGISPAEPNVIHGAIVPPLSVEERVGYLCRHLEVNWHASSPHFTLNVINLSSGENQQTRLVFKNNLDDFGEMPGENGHLLWFARVNSVLRSWYTPDLIIKYRGEEYLEGLNFTFASDANHFYCMGLTEADPVVDYTHFSDGRDSWKCSSFYILPA